MPDYILNALFVTVGLALLLRLISLTRRIAHPVPVFFINAVMGLCLLLTANKIGSLFGLGLGLNAVTLPVSAGLGAPGVVLLWALRYLL